MELRASNIIAAAAGVIIFDFVFCGVIAPKVLNAISLARKSKASCHCGGGCDSCAKNITDRSQVIDITDVRKQGVTVSV